MNRRHRSPGCTRCTLQSLGLGGALAALLLGAAAVPLRAQQHPNLARGVSESSSGGQLDAINEYNGNLTVRIPLGPSYPVGGRLSYGMGAALLGRLESILFSMR